MMKTKIDGVVLALWALFLPALLLLAGLIIMGGQGYIRQAELHHLAHQAGKSASVVLLDALEVKAQENYDLACEVEEPPSKCSSGTIQDFLEGQDVAETIMNTQVEVWALVKKFAVEYDPQNNLDAHQIEVLYPYDIQHDSTKCIVKMNVTIKDEVSWFFRFQNDDSGIIEGQAQIVIDLMG